MDPAAFDELERTLAAGGPTRPSTASATGLRDERDYAGLFYALLMKKRHELGV